MCDCNNREIGGLRLWETFRQGQLKLLNLLFVSFLFISLLPATVQAQSWYNSSWSYRKAITIDYTKVGTGPHTNFPILISTADADLQTGAQTDADDILFTSSDGTTKLDHEIESYTSASGTIVAWVEIPSLSSSANTVIYMYYGNAAASSQQNVTGTWDGTFKGVYHLNNAFSDATSNAYNGTNTGTTNVTGKISQGRGFVPGDGADKIQITGLMGSPSSITVSSWFYRNSTATEHSMIMSLGDHVNLMRTNTTESIEGNYYNGTTWLGTKTNINYDNGWHYAVYTCTANSQKIYVDGVLVTTSTNAAAISYPGLGTNTVIGGHANGSGSFDFDGNIDEARVANSIRTVGWILTEYNNQNSPSTFYSVGSEATNVPNYRTSASAGATSGVLSLVITKPTGTVSGDVMVAAISVRPSTATITAPSGWTLIRRTNNATGTTQSQATYWKAAGGSEPANYTWSFSASTGSAGGISTFYNVNTTNPVDVENGQTTASALTHATPSVTTTQASTIIVTTHSFVSCATWTPPTGMTETFDESSDAVPNGAGIAIEMNVIGQAAAGATGAKTATASGDGDLGVTQILALVTGTQWTGAVSTNWATAGNWSTGVVPSSATDIIIPTATNQPTISSSVNCRNLTINSGATVTTSAAGTLNITGDITNSGTMTNSGTTNFSGTTQQTFSGVTTFNNLILNNAGGLLLGGAVTINGDLTITSGTLATNNYNITLSGNLVNNGGFTAGTGSVTFAGSVSKTITGSSTTAFNTVIVNKGTDYNSVIDMQSLITMASGGLTLTNGTFKLSSASTVTPFTSDITTAPYRIPATAGIWANGGTISTTNNVTSAGLLRASAGTINIADGTDEKLLLANGANVIVDGGTMNVAGRLSYNLSSDVINFTISSGTFNVATVGSTTTNVAPFTIVNTASSFTMSGGTIVIMKGGGQNSGYSNVATTYNVTGGTLQIGSTSTLAADTIQIKSTPPIWNLTINSTNAPVAQLTTAFVVYNDLTIAGGKLDANNLDLTIGGNWLNNGTFIPGTATVTFNGTTTMSGTTVTNTFNNFTVAASSTVTSSSGLTGLVINGTLTTGASSTLDLGTTTILSGTLGTISNSGTIKTAVPTTTSATPIPSGKTWGGLIDYNNASANQTIIGGTYNDLTVRPGNAKIATASGNLVVNGILTVTTAFGAFDLSTYVLSGTLTSIINNGDIRTSVPTSTSATPIPAGKTWGGTIYYNAAAGAQTVVGGTYNIIRFSNTSGTNTAAGDLTVNNQFVTTAGGTLDMLSSYRIINMSGTITNNGTVKTSVLTSTSATPFASGKTWGGTGTVEYAAVTGAQTVMSGTFNNLKLSNTSGNNTISGNVTMNAILTLSGGTVTTNAFVISLNSAASVSRTGGHVIGNLKKSVATGAQSPIFEVGDATNYTPVTIAFASVTTSQYITVSVTASDHPNLSGSGIRTDKSVNRYWTFTNQGIVFTTATLTLNWVAGDVDAGSTTSSFITGNYSASAWTLPTTASPLATSIQATGLTAITGDFAAGQLCTATTTSNAGADQTGATTCGLTTVTLAGNTPSIGVGAWSIISGTGGTVTTPSSATSTFSGTVGSTYTLRWTISNTGCSTSTDDVIITFNQNPTTSNAGADQTSAATCGLTSVTLAGNSPSTGAGAWSIISGTGGTVTTPSSATSTFTGTAGTTYTLRWTISNSPCTASTDDVIITFNVSPTTSNAGADQTGAATCGLTTVTLAGNAPSVGTGAWSIISGTGGTVATPSSAASTFTGTAGSTYTIRWTTTNGSCTSTDDVIVTFNQNPTTSNAGPDQTGSATCGLTTVTLAGNSASVGTGAWSIVSGTGGTVTTPSSATSTFTGTAGTTYTLRWTISNSPCTASTDDVVITFNVNPTTANAGADQTGSATCGLTTVTLAGNSPSVGTGAWSIVSGSGGTVTTPSSATSTFTGTAGSTYTIRWTTTNGSCTSTDDAIITFNRNPTTANAGADQMSSATCGLTTITLAGNSPSVGTGAWSIVSGTGGTVTTPSSATSTFTGTAGTTYTLRWTISNSPCTASTDDVVISFNQTPTTSNAGPDQTGSATCGLTTVTLAGNSASVGTGAWSIVSGTGGTVTTPSSATSTFTGTAGTTYTLRWTISNSPCSASTDDVVITFNINPTASNAGADQTGAATCGLTTVSLAGNAPSVGTGVWSIISGTGGSFGNAASATSTFSGTAGTAYVLRWTISNSPCTASTDDVNITFNQSSTTSAAGADQTSSATCGLTTVTLSANAPSAGTGAWSIVSGSGGSFGNAAGATSTFNGTAGTAYTLRWTISNGPCTASTDDVVITFNINPTTANAGADQTGSATCGLTTVTLSGNAPSVGTGAWSIVSGTGGTVTTPSSAASTFTGTAGTTYTLRWTTTNGSCTSTDDVIITFNRNPTTANAGPDQTGSATCGVTTVTLAGNSPSVGTGAWSIVSGTGGTVTTPSSATSTFTGTSGTTYTLRWTISNSPCTASTDDVVITFNVNPTTSNAGADQTGSATCGLTIVTLAGNSPSVGTGAWSVISGTGGTVTTPSSAASTFTGTAGSTYTLRWTTTNGSCTSTDDVIITFNRNPTTANAGADQTSSATCGLTTVTLAGNSPSVGTGAWSIVSGTGGTVTTPSSATSTFTGTAGTTYTLRWTISNSPCTASTDDVVITFNVNPTTANAGADQTGSATCGLTTVTLAGNAPSVGTGAWSIISGTGGTVTTPSSAASTFTGTAGSTYTLRWTTTNGSCTSTDDVIITFNRNPTTANAGADQTGASTCGFTLAGNTPSVGTGAWSIVSGTGGTITTPSSPTSTFDGTAGTVYTLRWTTSNSPCTASTDDVVITLVASGTWSGAVSTAWSTTGNWYCGTLPTSSTNVTIPGGLTNYPSLSTGSGSVQNLTIQNGASLTVTGATLQVAGSISNSGTFTATGGTIAFIGSSAQTIPASTFAGNTITSLTINNTAGVTLGGTLNLTDALTVSGGSFATAGYLTLKSSAIATARVAQITSASGTPITGNVTVERYIPGRRRYRIITSSVTTSASATLSAGQEALSIWGNWQNQGNNITGNVGTIITGGTIVDGFDQQTANPSLFSYDDVNRVYTRYNTTNGKNTKYTPLKAGVPYYMFVYGDRLNTVSTANPNSTVIKASGTLLTGDQSYNTSSTIPLSNVTGRYTMLGNPFASPIDWGAVQKTNLSGTYWGWDPNMSSTGGYVTVSTAGSVTIIAPFSGTTGLNQYIQPGQGFFVKTTASSPSLVIREQDKVGNFNANAFRTGGNTANDVPLMAINLQYTSGANNILADGVVAAFDASFPNAVGDEDGGKMGNGTTTESVGIVEGTDLLSIDAKQLPQDKDTLFLDLKRLTKPQYTLEIFTQQMEGIPALPYLEDAYLQTSVPLSLADTNRIVFNVSAGNASSSAADRFRIVFKQLNVLPVTFTSIQAISKNSHIQIDWNVAQENGVKKYEVERSANGINFTRVAEVSAKGNNSTESYTWVDGNPFSGNNYYRIRAINHDSKVNLTKIVVAKTGAVSNDKLVVFPNPVQNQQINFQLRAIEKGQYTLELYSSQGQIILKTLFDHSSEITSHIIKPDKNLAGGLYYIQVAYKNGHYHQTLLIE